MVRWSARMVGVARLGAGRSSVLARRLASHVSLFSGSDLIGMSAGCVVPALLLGMAHIFVARSHFG